MSAASKGGMAALLRIQRLGGSVSLRVCLSMWLVEGTTSLAQSHRFYWLCPPLQLSSPAARRRDRPACTPGTLR